MKVLDTGVSDAATNMLIDEKLLNDLDPQGEPILHFYQWTHPSATYGYFIRPEKHLNLERARRYRLSFARRPTGGGIVFHIWDLAFSFLMPAAHPAFSFNPLENYRFVNSVVLEVMQLFFSLKEPVSLIPENFPNLGPDCQNFCMAKPTQYDVVYKGLKIAGAAQRKRKQGYLHQGTISLACPDTDLLQEVLLSQKAVLEAMQAYTFAPLGKIWQPHQLQQTRQEIQKRLAQVFLDRV